jgi:signal recognition particle receptor subunit beta
VCAINKVDVADRLAVQEARKAIAASLGIESLDLVAKDSGSARTTVNAALSIWEEAAGRLKTAPRE